MVITWTPEPVKPVMTVSLGDFRIEAIAVEVTRAWNGTEQLYVHSTMRVPAVADTWPDKAGVIIPVSAGAYVSEKLARASLRDRARVIKGQIMRLLEHEIEEKLMIDGEYAFDPHGTGRRMAKPKPKAIEWRAYPPPSFERVAGRFPAQSLVVPKTRGAYFPAVRGL